MKHGLVSSDLLDFYELHLLDNINSLRLKLGMDPIYNEVSSIFDFADTGERFGFRLSSMDSIESGSYEIVDTAVFSSSDTYLYAPKTRSQSLIVNYRIYRPRIEARSISATGPHAGISRCRG
jgi:hypothetical protein